MTQYQSYQFVYIGQPSVIVSLDLHHINYMAIATINMRIRTAGVQFMRDNQERFSESNTENG